MTRNAAGAFHIGQTDPLIDCGLHITSWLSGHNIGRIDVILITHKHNKRI
ncbi:MAG: hypothetical protein JRF49_05800 [Deltaproteobacteria bacterium]|nr:hypothetical protein [Deltaproteobacteria bacterium]